MEYINPIMDNSHQLYESNLMMEREFGVDKFETYEIFAERVESSKDLLYRKLSNLKQ